MEVRKMIEEIVKTAKESDIYDLMRIHDALGMFIGKFCYDNNDNNEFVRSYKLISVGDNQEKGRKILIENIEFILKISEYFCSRKNSKLEASQLFDNYFSKEENLNGHTITIYDAMREYDTQLCVLRRLLKSNGDNTNYPKDAIANGDIYESSIKVMAHFGKNGLTKAVNDTNRAISLLGTHILNKYFLTKNETPKYLH